MGRESETFGRRLGRSLGSFAKGLAFGGVAATVGALTLALHEGFREFEHSQKVVAQTNAVLESTKNIAGVTASEIDELARSISNYSGIDNEAIQAGENLLLTFTHIRNRVGEGNDIFNQATAAVTDLSVAMGLDARKSALQLGKALNAPERGYARLQRIGVQFTKQQVALIKGFVRQGREMDAQKVILAELNTEFGGSARALGETLPGRVDRLRETMRNFAGDLVTGLAPAIEMSVQRLTDWFSNTENQAVVQQRLEGIVKTGRNVINGFVSAVKSAAPPVRALTTAVGGTENAVKLLVAAMAVAKIRTFAIELGLIGPAGVKAAVGMGTATKATAASSVAVGSFTRNMAVMEAAAAIRFGAVGTSAAKLLSTLFLLRTPITIVIGIELLRGGAELKTIKRGISELVSDFGHGKFSDALFGREVVPASVKAQIADVNRQFATLPLGARQAGQKMAEELSKDPTKSLTEKIQAMMDLLDRLRAKTAAAASASIEGVRATTEAALARTEAFGGLALVAAGDTPRGPSADQRNQWFDQLVGRRLDRTQDIRSLQGQVQELEQIKALIEQRISRTQDVTRRLNLEDKALQVGRQIAQARQAVADAFIDGLQLKVDRTALTKSLKDDLAATNALISGLQVQLKQQGHSNDLERQLLSATQQRNAILDQIAQAKAQQQIKLKEARTAKQFRQLGLTATGDEPVPGVRALRRQLLSVEGAVQGTFLDTGKTKSLLGRVKSVLSAGLNGVSREVRAKISEMLNDVDQQLKDHGGDPTKFKKQSVNQILAGVGLSPDEIRALRSRLSLVGTGGTVAAGRSGGVGAFGFVLPPVEIHHTTVVDGRVVETSVTKRQQQRKQRASTQKRGPNVG